MTAPRKQWNEEGFSFPYPGMSLSDKLRYRQIVRLCVNDEGENVQMGEIFANYDYFMRHHSEFDLISFCGGVV
jgi:hypothetical protein